MKHLKLLFFFFIVLVACEPEEIPVKFLHEDETEVIVNTKVNGLGANTTKSIGVASGNNIKNIQLFCFYVGGTRDGLLDDCKSLGFDNALNVSAINSGIELRCTIGKRVFYALVNDSIDHTKGANAISSLSELKNLTHDLSSDYVDQLFMMGSSAEITLTPSVKDVSIIVKRQCANIILNSITNNFQVEAYRANDSFKIASVYLLNVPGRIRVSGELFASNLADQFWYNRNSLDSDAEKLRLTADIVASGSETMLNFSGKITTKHSFYSFPNNNASRRTLLVVEGLKKYGGSWIKCYYPIELKIDLEANKQYVVDLSIQSLGSDSPNKPVEIAELGSTISVLEWESGSEWSSEI